jgi:uncharacterized SAM-binding protein YcdF (DUF218 family)
VSLKPLASPLAWLVLVQGVGLAVLWRSRTGRSRALRVVTAAWAALTLLSLEPAALSLAWLVTDRADAPAITPALIVVPGDGFTRAPDPADDVLSIYSVERAIAAAEWWKTVPTARILLSGRSTATDRPGEHLGELEAAVLMEHGVPRDRILIDGVSRNTREHVDEALRQPGVTAETPIAIVTSTWHLRRARQVFARRFSQVTWRKPEQHEREFDWSSFIPSEGALGESGFYLRELVGAVWYALRSAVAP